LIGEYTLTQCIEIDVRAHLPPPSSDVLSTYDIVKGNLPILMNIDRPFAHNTDFA
jgi:hypothetical protein